MTTPPARVVRSRTPLPAVAWLLPGGSAGAWLDEAAALGMPLAAARFLPVPRSAGDRTPVAAVLLPADAEVARAAVCRGSAGRALPLARIGARLFVPCDSRIDPPADPAEADAAIGCAWALLHPVHGCIGWDVSDALAVADLVVPPERPRSSWDAADPGVRAATLREVRPDSTPDAAAAIEGGRGDVATKPPDPGGRAPGQRGRSLKDRAKDWVARRAARMTSSVPHTGSQRTWVNDVEDWASDRLRRAAAESRQQAIDRLLHLLQTDPEEGLRHALPLVGGPGRGVAEPGTSLPRHGTDFSDARLGGGVPVAAWQVDDARRLALRKSYGLQALRAEKLGAHRRAAYIHAELLGDLRAAALALQRGSHFREAAALYRERLKDPAAAARCLESGGLLTEAAALHDGLGDLAEAARLLDRVGRREEAVTRWLALAESRRASGDLVGAARVHLESLREPAKALAILDDGWPAGGNAHARLAFALEILGATGPVGEARRWIRRARELGGTAEVPIVEALAASATRFPDAEIRGECARAVRELGAVSLARSPGTPDRRILEAIARTDPSDRVLAADVHGWISGTRRPATAQPDAARGRHPRAAREVTVAFDIVLADIEPSREAVVRVREGLLVFGHAPARLVAVLAMVDRAGGEAARTTWNVDRRLQRASRLLVDPVRRRIAILCPGGSRIPEQTLALPGGRSWVAERPSWVPDGVLAACEGEAATAWTIEPDTASGDVVAVCRAPTGRELRRIAVPIDSASRWIVAASLGRTLFVADGRSLVRVSDDDTVVRLGDSAATALSTKRGLHGAMLVDAGPDGCGLTLDADSAVPSQRIAFVTDAADPCAAILPNGRIAVADETRVRIFRCEGSRIRCSDEWSHEAGRVRALVPGAADGEVVLVTGRQARLDEAGTTRSLRLVGLRLPGV